MNFQPRLFREARASGWLFPLAVITAFLAGGLAIFQSYQLSRVISGVFLDDRTLAQVTPLLRLILLVVLFRVLFTYLNEMLSGHLAVTVKMRLRTLLLEKIDRLGPEYLKNETTAELTTTALQGVDALEAYFAQYLPQVLIAVILPLTILLVVFPLDLVTGIVFLLTAPLIPLFMVLIGKTVEALTGRQWRALTRLGNYFLDTLQGIATLKLLGRNRERAREIRTVSEQYRETTLNVLRITFLTALALELIATLSTAVVAVEIGLRLLYGRIVFQQAFFILLIAPDFYLPLRNLSARYHAGISGITAAEKIYSVLDAPDLYAEPVRQPETLGHLFEGNFQIALRHLSHTYPGMKENSLENVSLSLERGRHYAIAGKSGAGKSTLARILLRFIEPDAGDLLINDEDFRSWSRETWRKYVGWLPQSPTIFNASIFHNLTLGDPGFTRGQILHALENAELSALVGGLPRGLETSMLEAGNRFSGGELQRVALARIYLRDPQILVMDEPIAHLDPGLQRVLNSSIRRMMTGRTTLTIAHHVSTLEQVDEVFYLKDGRLIAQGCHSDLLSSSQEYRDFIDSRDQLI